MIKPNHVESFFLVGKPAHGTCSYLHCRLKPRVRVFHKKPGARQTTVDRICVYHALVLANAAILEERTKDAH